VPPALPLGRVRTSDALLNFAMLLANIYGLMLVVAFMSYGIVDIPRRLWYKSDHGFQSRYVQFKVPAYREDYEEAEENLRDVYRVRPRRGATAARTLARPELTPSRCPKRPRARCVLTGDQLVRPQGAGAQPPPQVAGRHHLQGAPQRFCAGRRRGRADARSRGASREGSRAGAGRVRRRGR